MLLNLTAIYGMRAMAVLAELAAGESLNAAGLSARTGVPQQYLSKIMRKLVVARLVSGQRGRGGGFQLNRPARQVRIVDILDAVAIELDGGCAFGYASCDEQNQCPLHPIWSRLKASITEWGQNSTLDEIVPPSRLRSRQR